MAPRVIIAMEKDANIRTVVLILVGMSYLFIGAGIFNAVEREHEKTRGNQLFNQESEIKKRYNISEVDYNNLTVIILELEPHKAGIQWSFVGALYFAITVVTTIGYGHAVPQTLTGKLICIFYAIFGIPLCLIMFQAMGERINTAAKNSLKVVGHKMGFKFDKVSHRCLVPFGILSCCLTVMIGSIAFAHFENWTYMNSVYYCVMTLTTIGFGDYVALQDDGALQHSPHYVAFSFIYILIGLTVIGAFLNLVILRLMVTLPVTPDGSSNGDKPGENLNDSLSTHGSDYNDEERHARNCSSYNCNVNNKHNRMHAMWLRTQKSARSFSNISLSRREDDITDSLHTDNYISHKQLTRSRKYHSTSCRLAKHCHWCGTRHQSALKYACNGDSVHRNRILGNDFFMDTQHAAPACLRHKACHLATTQDPTALHANKSCPPRFENGGNSVARSDMVEGNCLGLPELTTKPLSSVHAIAGRSEEAENNKVTSHASLNTPGTYLTLPLWVGDQRDRYLSGDSGYSGTSGMQGSSFVLTPESKETKDTTKDLHLVDNDLQRSQEDSEKLPRSRSRSVDVLYSPKLSRRRSTSPLVQDGPLVYYNKGSSVTVLNRKTPNDQQEGSFYKGTMSTPASHSDTEISPGKTQLAKVEAAENNKSIPLTSSRVTSSQLIRQKALHAMPSIVVTSTPSNHKRAFSESLSHQDSNETAISNLTNTDCEDMIFSEDSTTQKTEPKSADISLVKEVNTPDARKSVRILKPKLVRNSKKTVDCFDNWIEMGEVLRNDSMEDNVFAEQSRPRACSVPVYHGYQDCECLWCFNNRKLCCNCTRRFSLVHSRPMANCQGWIHHEQRPDCGNCDVVRYERERAPSAGRNRKRSRSTRRRTQQQGENTARRLVEPRANNDSHKSRFFSESIWSWFSRKPDHETPCVARLSTGCNSSRDNADRHHDDQSDSEAEVTSCATAQAGSAFCRRERIPLRPKFKRGRKIVEPNCCVGPSHNQHCCQMNGRSPLEIGCSVDNCDFHARANCSNELLDNGADIELRGNVNTSIHAPRQVDSIDFASRRCSIASFGDDFDTVSLLSNISSSPSQPDCHRFELS